LNTNARLVVLHVTVYNTGRSSFAGTIKKILGAKMKSIPTSSGTTTSLHVRHWEVVTPQELATVVRPSSQALVLGQVLSYNEAPERNSAWSNEAAQPDRA